MHIMLTVSSLICAFATMFACWFCFRTAQSSAENVQEAFRTCAATGVELSKVRAERARVTVLERENEALRKWIQRVDGKLSSLQREMPPYEPAEADLNRAGDVLAAPLSANLTVCENYAQAQREGPLSAAASCDCPYCTAKRTERDALREKARQLPSHAATVRAIKANS